MMLSLVGKLSLFAAAASAAFYLLSWCLGVRFFCCCCRSFTVLVMLYLVVDLVLSAAASICCWLSCLVMLCLGKFVLVVAAAVAVH
ncbi:hypothetical protein MAM1_0062d03837 [Mucor ambiguus]|uniref:Uncharacterized protein n=1 Tax=Mucor ambiguus TaxID=91626 RepID=A0A0C9MMK8_9FUNG|nr:hypothetical protein MAM1_0062d03837 [Mucor ambiguus]